MKTDKGYRVTKEVESEKKDRRKIGRMKRKVSSSKVIVRKVLGCERTGNQK